MSDDLDALMDDSEVPPWEQEPEADSKTVVADIDSGEVYDLDDESGIPNLYEAVQIKQDLGTEGEEYSFLVVLVTAAGGGGMVAMTGPSRSGKDMIVDAVEELFPRDFGKVPPSLSEPALFGKRGELNQAPVHRYEDLVDLSEHVENMMKMHGEGKPNTREIQEQDEDGNWFNLEQTLTAPGCQIFFLASDNARVKLSDFTEVENRALVVATDSSQGLTEDIQQRQMKEAGLAYEQNLEPDSIDAMRQHIRTLPKDRWDIGASENGAQNRDFLNPCWEAFWDEHPIPSQFVESRFDSNRLIDFMEIITLWHHENRIVTPMEYKGVEKDRMIVTPKDVWLTMRVYGEKLVMSALSLRDIDHKVLNLLRETNEPFSVSRMTQILSEAGFNVTTNDVRDAAETLTENNYLNKDSEGSGNVEFRAAPFAASVNEYQTVDYDKVVEGAAEEVQERLPASVADEYVDRFCQGSMIESVVHPVTGEVCDIREYNGFQKKIEQREEELEAMLSTSMFENQQYGRDPPNDAPDKKGSESEKAASNGQASFGDSGVNLG